MIRYNGSPKETYQLKKTLFGICGANHLKVREPMWIATCILLTKNPIGAGTESFISLKEILNYNKNFSNCRR